MQAKTRRFRLLAMFSYFGLLIWVPVWHLFLAEPVGRSAEFEIFLTLVWTIPLLFPLKGIITGNPYTYAWSNFVVMFYLIHGLTSVYAVSSEIWFGVIELLLATGMFVGCSFFARLRGKELGLSLKKLKQEMEEEKRLFEKS